MRKYSDAGFVRIQRRTAEKLFDAGRVIYLLPCRLTPSSPRAVPAGYEKRATDSKGYAALVAAYTRHSCNSRAAGYYPAFYVKK